jgi:hypothetical protein
VRWQHFVGRNCWSDGHGAHVSAPPEGSTAGVISLAACQGACVRRARVAAGQTRCDGLVYDDSQSRCSLVADLQPSQCAADSRYDLYVLVRPPRMAVVVHGLIDESGYTLHSSGADVVGHPIQHDFLRVAWASMRDQLILPARRTCGMRVDVYVVMHAHSRARMSDDYWARLHAIDHSTTVWVAPAEVADTAFDVLQAFLTHLAPRAARTYDLVLRTRDDFVYDDGSWGVVAQCYRPTKLNQVSTDCNRNRWDGLHIFPGALVHMYADAFKASHVNGHHVSTEQPLHLWFAGMYGQPDRCRPAMGYLDRGGPNSHTMREDTSNQTNRDPCCAAPHMEARAMDKVRSCPILQADV